jgi:hypothetical protein
VTLLRTPRRGTNRAREGTPIEDHLIVGRGVTATLYM